MQFSADKYLEPLVEDFKENVDAAKADQMYRYMKQHFSYFGIQQPLRKKIWSKFKEANGSPEPEYVNDIVKTLWSYDEREFQMVALDLLYESRNTWKENQIELLEKLIITKSWWDTVDMLSAKLASIYFLKFPNRIPVTEKWNQSENMWLNRSAILFQLKYKSRTDFELLTSYILNHKESKEFFIKKAIGWALREYAKTDASAVLEFVHSNHLQPLSEREALKHLTQRTR